MSVEVVGCSTEEKLATEAMLRWRCCCFLGGSGARLDSLSRLRRSGRMGEAADVKPWP